MTCCAHMQVSQMKHGLSVVADLTKGDAEMQRAVQETIDAFGGVDIIVNRYTAAPFNRQNFPAEQATKGLEQASGLQPQPLSGVGYK